MVLITSLAVGLNQCFEGEVMTRDSAEESGADAPEGRRDDMF